MNVPIELEKHSEPSQSTHSMASMTFMTRIIRAITGFTFLLILIAIPLYAYKVSQKQDYTDFSVYYQAALRAKNAQWSEIYNLKDGASPFRYAPPLIPFFRPFAELPQSQAQLLWYFLQISWFSAGLFLLYLSLKRCTKTWALAITCLTVLFTLRFFLDTLTIGQSSSLLFLGFCIGLYAWVTEKYSIATAGVFIPTLFKIGPGFLYGIFLTGGRGALKKGLRTGIFLAVALALFQFFSAPYFWKSISNWLSASTWASSWEWSKNLWQSWFQIVLNDSVYYDASHYGSQSFKSFLLRGINLGWWTAGFADGAYLALAGMVCGGVLLFWLLRRPRSSYGRALFFSIGLFPYFWVMPETFKYSLTPLAIPVAFIMSNPRKSRLSWFSLGFGVLTLSLAGKDIVGDPIFFGNQAHSIPLLATVFLALALIELAWKSSVLSPAGNALLSAFQATRALGPWNELPRKDRDLEASLLIPIEGESLNEAELSTLRTFLGEAHFALKEVIGERFEILLIANARQKLDPDLLQYSQFVIHPDPYTDNVFAGRGLLLRTGFLASRGQRILFAHPAQPCSAQFFQEAIRLLDSGVDLVRANRRLKQSTFRIPVRLLSLVYGRHRFGLLFNRLVRIFLPIQTTDTHSGTLGISYRLASQAFAVQSSPGFLFDLELDLTAAAHGYKMQDLPALLVLGSEKSVSKIAYEIFSILLGIIPLALRYRSGCYDPCSQPTGITADDWGISSGVNQGILQLARTGVVRRVSLMANGPFLKEGLQELCSLQGVELGIHFNLTYGKPCHESKDLDPTRTPSPLSFLLRWLMPFQNKARLIEAVQLELSSQLESLRRAGVKNVSYLDGHHHIHLVPGLMKAISETLQARGIQKVRLPADPMLWCTGKAPLLLFSWMLRPTLKAKGFKWMPCIYPRLATLLDQGKLRQLLNRAPHAEVIVHPAETNDLDMLEYPDSYTEARVLEFHALRMVKW